VKVFVNIMYFNCLAYLITLTRVPERMSKFSHLEMVRISRNTKGQILTFYRPNAIRFI